MFADIRATTIFCEDFGLASDYQRAATHSTEQSGTANYLWQETYFDGFGRTIGTHREGPDGTYVTKSYLLGTTASVDANGHKREEDRDTYGRLAKVREYTGTSPNFSLYATTQYMYDTLGNLVQVTDAAGHNTLIGYDTLSRKTSMTDPDMGYWTYQYDANGNLASQTDARNYQITLTYDALNRLTNNHYPMPWDRKRRDPMRCQKWYHRLR